MGILIRDPVAREREAREYREAVEKAQRTGDPWPEMPRPTKAEEEYQRSVSSREGAYRSFTQPGMACCPAWGDEAPKPLDESPQALDESFPVKDASPFKLGGK